MRVFVQCDVNNNIATLFICIDGMEKKEGLSPIDVFGGLPTIATIYDMKHRVTVPMPAHRINHGCSIEGSWKNRQKNIY